MIYLEELTFLLSYFGIEKKLQQWCKTLHKSYYVAIQILMTDIKNSKRVAKNLSILVVAGGGFFFYRNSNIVKIGEVR